MKHNKEKPLSLTPFYLFWTSQLSSQIGSSMSSFAMTLYVLETTDSAFLSAVLSISFYIPYSIASVFAGVFTDRFSKKKMIQICDSIAACGTLLILLLQSAGQLQIWQMFLVNVANGICNSFQNPASEMAMNRLIPAEAVQKTSGLRALSWSLNVFLHPLLAAALYPLVGLQGILCIDLTTFLIAFSTLQFWIQLPKGMKDQNAAQKPSFIKELTEGFSWLKTHRLILGLIVFMAAVNFNASAFDNALPVYLINLSGSTNLVGIISSSAGAAMILASLVVTMLPEPKDRIRVIVISMLISLSADNFLMPFVHSTWALILAQFLGYFPVPFLNGNLTAIFQTEVPQPIQGRVYACRNALQFLTIPLGSIFSGYVIDQIIPRLLEHVPLELLPSKGAARPAALVIFFLGITGLTSCILAGIWFRKEKRKNKAG